ncbi:hypothetical protein SRABI26_03604 [Arthrobacter sp. Bi26]|nr:hypothetical protein SRABI26_03604 [Arthrobacter sp. Bi26]
MVHMKITAYMNLQPKHVHLDLTTGRHHRPAETDEDARITSESFHPIMTYGQPLPAEGAQ